MTMTTMTVTTACSLPPTGLCVDRTAAGALCEGLGECVDNAECSSRFGGLCECQQDFYQDSSGQCQKRKNVNKPCADSQECVAGASCERGVCACEDGHYRDLGKCYPKKVVNDR